MERQVRTVNMTIASGAALSGPVRMLDMAMGEIHMPSAWTAASVAFQVSDQQGGSYLPLYDADGNLVEITATVDQAFSLPAEVAGSAWVKLWSETSGSGINQAAARTIKLIIKS